MRIKHYNGPTADPALDADNYARDLEEEAERDEDYDEWCELQRRLAGRLWRAEDRD